MTSSNPYVAVIPNTPPLRAPTLLPSEVVERDNSSLTRAVFHEIRQNQPANTRIAYDPKIKEFLSYCDAMHADENDAIRHLVTPTKVYNFMFFQAHREKRKPGTATGFSVEEYKEVIGRYAGKTPAEWLPPQNPIQFQQFNTYKSSLIELHKEQVANRANTFVWGHDIWTTHCECLYDSVKSRRNKMKKANYVKKVDETFSFFKAYGKATKIENALWLKASNCGLRAAFPAIR